MMFALAGQGIIPGLVLCQGDEGHVAVEVAFDRYCASSLLTSSQAPKTHSLDAMDLRAPDGCGPCSDTPILVNPLRLPTHERNANFSQVQCAIIVTGSDTGCANIKANDWLDPLTSTLILTKTSVLLI